MEHDLLQAPSSEHRLEKWARIFLLLGLALLPILVIPIQGFPFLLAKFFVFSVFIVLSLVCFALSSIKMGTLYIPRTKLTSVVVALVIAYGFATALSQDWKLSLAGIGAEVDTFFFIAVASITFLLCSALFSAKGSVRSFFTVLLASGAVVGVFQLVRFIIGDALFSSTVFSSVSYNFVGAWNDFGLLMAAVVSLSASLIDSKRARGLSFIVLWLLLLGALALLSVVNFTTTWWLLIASSAIVLFGTLRFSVMHAHEASSSFIFSKIPVASLLVAVVAGAFLAWSSVFMPYIQKIASVNVAEVQLTPDTTVNVMRSTYAQSALTTFFGSGPNTFGQQWLLYKPASLTNSQFWTLDFAAAFSLVMTAFVTGGLVTGIVFLALPVLALILFLRRVGAITERDKREIVISTAALLAVLFGALCFYVPGQVITLLAFATLGVFATWLSYEGELVVPAQKWNSFATLILLAFVAIAAAGTGAIGNRLVGGVYEGRALTAATAGDISSAQASAGKALSVYRSEGTLHLMASLKFAEAQAIAAETDKTTESTRPQRFQAALGDANTYAREATNTYPTHWNNWLTLAQLYEALIPLKIDGAYQESEVAYANAIRLSPRNPQLYLMAARMEAAAGNEQSARSAVGQALALKQNYTDAILFIVELEVAKNNLDAALNASAAAVQTAPDNAGLWFQLGVLAYNKGDDATASGAFEKSISLLPAYANAKYFLGLTYYRMGKVGDSVAIFEELAKQNPDNTDVAAILTAIMSGKSPFPPAAKTPSEAPVKEQ